MKYLLINLLLILTSLTASAQGFHNIKWGTSLSEVMKNTCAAQHLAHKGQLFTLQTINSVETSTTYLFTEDKLSSVQVKLELAGRQGNKKHCTAIINALTSKYSTPLVTKTERLITYTYKTSTTVIKFRTGSTGMSRVYNIEYKPVVPIGLTMEQKYSKLL